MKQWKRFYSPPTEDFPVTVYYFYPLSLSPTPRPFSRHPEMELILLRTGRARFFCREQVFDLEAGDIALISPLDLHGYQSLTMDVTEVSVKFNTDMLLFSPGFFLQKEFLEPLAAGAIKLPPVLRKGHPAYDEVYQGLCRFHPDMEGQPGYRQSQLLGIIQVCCALSDCSVASGIPAVYDGAVSRCLRYLQENYTQKLTLEQIAAAVGLHPNYLCARFKEVTGQTIFDQLTAVRLDAALRILTSTDLPPGELWRLCGFNNLRYFNKKFAQRFGSTPKQYQRRFSFLREQAKE